MAIKDDDIETTYSEDLSSAESSVPVGGETDGDGKALPFDLDGHASGDPDEHGGDAGADAGVDPPVDTQGPGDVGAFEHEQAGQQDGGSDSGAEPPPGPVERS